MILSDTLSYIDEPNNAFISTYSYPNDHPLIKGHFPKNPIMMGVMQWATLEDALCSYLSHTQTTGTHTWTCNALIYNQHKVLVSTIKNCTLKSWINVSGIKNQAEIQSTQRIMFKNMVKPGDTLYTHITDLKKQ
jgi:3-hydroxymyristoyl/3-hydroxydecanoyl-(acyl carrier protein) dehydratase